MVSRIICFHGIPKVVWLVLERQSYLLFSRATSDVAWSHSRQATTINAMRTRNGLIQTFSFENESADRNLLFHQAAWLFHLPTNKPSGYMLFRDVMQDDQDLFPPATINKNILLRLLHMKSYHAFSFDYTSFLPLPLLVGSMISYKLDASRVVVHILCFLKQ